MIRYFNLLVVTSVLSLFGISQAQYDTLRYDNLDRTYLLHVPESINDQSDVPLVIALHNAYGNATSFQSLTGFSEKADSENFIVAYPNGTGSPTSWNAGGCCLPAMKNDIDEAGFISVLIDTISANYHIDSARVFVAGFSNGSIMAYRLAAEMSDKIAAIAAASGPMMMDEYDPVRAVPIIEFHCLDDLSVPYNGGKASGYTFPSVDSIITIWIGINGCETEPEIIYNENGAVGKKWAAINNNADIILYTKEKGGHSWPESPYSATDLVWDFFSSHPMNSITGIQPTGKSYTVKDFMLNQNYPNPFNPKTHIAFDLPVAQNILFEVYNITGQKVATLANGKLSAGNHTVTFNAYTLSSGIYFYKIVAENQVYVKRMVLLK